MRSWVTSLNLEEFALGLGSYVLITKMKVKIAINKFQIWTRTYKRTISQTKVAVLPRMLIG